ncbi:hypothetical protein AGMMS49546_01240 [Spirochaetia bacterium]|nr:hypothetical protein AGMMS49546_01240 [Spirochaetia bacterium]
MQTEILDDTKILYSPKTRSILIVISALLVICCLFILISIQTNSAKILTLYVLTMGTVSQTGPSDKVMGITNGLLLLLNQVR